MKNLITYIATDSGVAKEYTYCIRCGRPLKTPEARKIGYGPVCWQKKLAQKTKRRLF